MATDKVWLITGAGRGLGVDIAKAALDGGHKVVATGRNTVFPQSISTMVRATTCGSHLVRSSGSEFSPERATSSSDGYNSRLH